MSTSNHLLPRLGTYFNRILKSTDNTTLKLLGRSTPKSTGTVILLIYSVRYLSVYLQKYLNNHLGHAVRSIWRSYLGQDLQIRCKWLEVRDEATRQLISRQKLAGQLQSTLELFSKTPAKVEFEPLSTVSPKLLETTLQHDFSSTFQVVFATLSGENANTQLEVT